MLRALYPAPADGEDSATPSGLLQLFRPALEALAAPSERRRAFHINAGPHAPIFEAVGATLSDPAQRLLWHGTSWEGLLNILRNGFNRAFSGRHGSRFGVGTYFTADASYALRFCDRFPAPRALLLARVLVGRYAKGAPGMVEPPLLEAGSGGAAGRRYDSTVDDCRNPRVFCVFRDFQALPVGLLVLG